MSLTSKQTRHLRALAHHLSPTVQVGGRGVTDAVIAKTDEELEHHELIKVKCTDADRQELKEAAAALAAGTGAAVAQIIGKTVVLYRAREKDPEIELPPA